MISAAVVLFDLGNTLFVDNPARWPGVYKRAESALWKVLGEAGVSLSPAVLYAEQTTLLRYYYALRGDGVEEQGTFHVLKQVLTQHHVTASDAVLATALRAMYAVTQTNWRADSNSAKTLEILKNRGFRLGAVTNGSDNQNALELLGRARLQEYFEIVITSAHFGLRKPDPAIFGAALRHFQVEPRQAVMVGDSYDADVVGAHNLGMSSIWLNRRRTGQRLAQGAVADAVVASLREVPSVLA